MKYPTADLCSAGDQIYDSVHARRAPYPLSYTSRLLLVSLRINNKVQKWDINYSRRARGYSFTEHPLSMHHVRGQDYCVQFCFLASPGSFLS